MKEIAMLLGIAAAALVVVAFVVLTLITIAIIISTKGKPFWTWEGR